MDLEKFMDNIDENGKPFLSEEDRAFIRKMHSSPNPVPTVKMMGPHNKMEKLRMIYLCILNCDEWCKDYYIQPS